jgi:hypothetical protein
MWLGREDSNLRMAESKSVNFPNRINSHFEIKRDFPLSLINALQVISK